MTAQAGAILNMSSTWDAIDWRTIEDNVRRLQARIVKAVQQKKWNKGKALQHLLTHSASGLVCALLLLVSHVSNVKTMTVRTEKKISFPMICSRRDMRSAPEGVAAVCRSSIRPIVLPLVLQATQEENSIRQKSPVRTRSKSGVCVLMKTPLRKTQFI